MNERSMQFRVGLVVVLTLALGVTLVAMFSQPTGLFEEHITIYVDAPVAPGVTKDTPVRKHGILVGRVKDVQLSDVGVRIAVALNTKFRDKVRRSDVCRVGGGSLLGDAVLAVLPGDPQLPADVVQENDVLRGAAHVDPFQVIGNLDNQMARVVQSVAGASDSVAQLAQRLQGFVQANDGQFGAVLSRSTQTLENLGKVAQNVDSIVQDPQVSANLKQALQELPALLRDAREATTGIKKTLASADASFVSVQRAAEPLTESGKGMIENADELFRKLGRSADKLEELVENMVVFSQALNNREGTLGKLLADSQLYDNLNNTLSNVNHLTDNVNRLAVELRPVLYNTRLFTDKIARHPETLGVRGAIEGGGDGSKPVRPVYPR
jgi:phospholipid/cholesterol/gamma-HCH transport system substrate-binding protein